MMIKNILIFICLTSVNLLFGATDKLGLFGWVMDKSELVVKVELIHGYDNSTLVKPLEVYHGECNHDSIWIYTNHSKFLEKIYKKGDTVILFLQAPANSSGNHITSASNKPAQVKENVYFVPEYQLVKYNSLDLAHQKVSNDSIFYDLNAYGEDYSPSWHSLNDYEQFLKAVFQGNEAPLLTEKLIHRLNPEQNELQTIHDLNMLYYLGLTKYEAIFDELKNFIDEIFLKIIINSCCCSCFSNYFARN